MKKNILLLLLLIPAFLISSGQKKRDALYLKNGSIIYGKLIEANADQYKITSTDGSIFVYSSSEVERFTQEPTVEVIRSEKKTGMALEAGFLVGPQSSNYVAPFSFNFLMYYTPDNRSFLSLGSGVEFVGNSYTPLFFEYKYMLNDHSTTPYLFGRGGGLVYMGGGDEGDYYYGYPYYGSERDYKGGFSGLIGTGISWSKENYSMYLSFGFRFLRTSYEDSMPVATVTQNYRRLEMKYGFRF